MKTLAFIAAALVITTNALADTTTIVIDQPKGSVQICNYICDESGRNCRIVCA